MMFLITFAVSFVVSLAVTPFTRNIAYKIGAIDKPKKRGMHSKPMPRVGGIAIVAGFFVAILILSLFRHEIRTLQFLGFVIGAAVIVACGILDDVYRLKPFVKLIFQALAAVIVIATGTTFHFATIHVPAALTPFMIIITFVWIVGMINAMNLIDGLDGLAAGVASISSIALLILCIITQNELAIFLTAALAGSTLGFLPRNFNPADVIMGDSGALFLGYVLAVTSIIGLFKSFALLTIIIVLLVLALPIFDTTFAIIRRLLKRQPVMAPDRGHLHHRLIDAGFTTKQAVLILYLISIVAAAIAVIIYVWDIRSIIFIIVVIVILAVVIYSYWKRTKREKDEDTEGDEHGKTL